MAEISITLAIKIIGGWIDGNVEYAIVEISSDSFDPFWQLLEINHSA